MEQEFYSRLEFTRACALSEFCFVASSVKTTSDFYEPESTLWRYERAGEQTTWVKRHITAHVERIVATKDAKDCAVLSAEGEIFFDAFGDTSHERIMGGGTCIDGAKGYGRMLALAQSGTDFYASGNSGQIYFKHEIGQWQLLTDQLLYNPEAESRINETAPLTTDPEFLNWLMTSMSKRPRNIAFHDVCALRSDAVYLCGVDATKPILCFWDGSNLRELKVHLDKAALTGIHIENEDSVWVCGREGVLLHGSYARGFTQVNIRKQLNLFHRITPYRCKLVLPSSVRPGGLFELDPATSDLRRFTPALPKLRGDYIFYAEAANDVLWVVGQKDIFRFDGSEWERIEHPFI